jgi:hypothetical protein
MLEPVSPKYDLEGEKTVQHKDSPQTAAFRSSADCPAFPEAGAKAPGMKHQIRQRFQANPQKTARFTKLPGLTSPDRNVDLTVKVRSESVGFLRAA